MHVAQHLFTFLLVMFGAGCADDMPVTANYVPADCPPVTQPAEEAEVVDPPDPQPAPDTEVEKAPADRDTHTIDINTASEMELTRLPGVGPALAARITAYRRKRAFDRLEDIRRVRGIGPAKYEKLKDAISVGKKRQKRQM